MRVSLFSYKLLKLALDLQRPLVQSWLLDNSLNDSLRFTYFFIFTVLTS
jgi:hypothetical protein